MRRLTTVLFLSLVFSSDLRAAPWPFSCPKTAEKEEPSDYDVDTIRAKAESYRRRFLTGDGADIPFPSAADEQIAFLSAALATARNRDSSFVRRELAELPRAQVDRIFAEIRPSREDITSRSVSRALARFYGLQMSLLAAKRGYSFSWNRRVEAKIVTYLVRRLSEGPVLDGLRRLGFAFPADVRFWNRLRGEYARRPSARKLALSAALNLGPQIVLNHFLPGAGYYPFGFGANLRMDAPAVPDSIFELGEREGFSAAAQAWMASDPSLRLRASLEAGADVGSRLYALVALAAVGGVLYVYRDELAFLWEIIGLDPADIRAAEARKTCDTLRKEALASWRESYDAFHEEAPATEAQIADQRGILERTPCDDLKAFR